VRYAFIDGACQRHSISVLCRVLRVSKSGFYAWRSRTPSARERANAALITEIRRVHREHRQACGALKTWKALNREGIPCGKHRCQRQ
jgi:hypothetical protein